MYRLQPMETLLKGNRLGVAVAGLLLLFLVFPQSVSESPEEDPHERQAAISVDYSKENIEKIIRVAARQYGVDEERMLQVAKCESSLRPRVIGDDGNSIGLFQIHLPSHPEVTQEQALDPEWSSEWSAKKFQEGKQNIWVCYRKLYNNQ